MPPQLLTARVVRRSALAYADGQSEALDRPAFIRAASGLAWVGRSLVVLQDDVNFIGVISPAGHIRGIPLPRGPGGRRRFEERLGNRLEKLDLETGVSVTTPFGPRLLAFGSGSRSERQVALLMDIDCDSEPVVFDARTLFGAIGDALELGPSLPNIEGSVILDDTLRLFHRGAVSKSVDFDLRTMLRWLEHLAHETSGSQSEPVQTPEVLPESVRHYTLGNVDGVPYGLTDASAISVDRIVFVASAENTLDPVLDGKVLGSMFGVIDSGEVRHATIWDENDAPLTEKAEGVVADRERPNVFWVCVDPDDPDRPGELCEVVVEGLR